MNQDSVNKGKVCVKLQKCEAGYIWLKGSLKYTDLNNSLKSDGDYV